MLKMAAYINSFASNGIEQISAILRMLLLYFIKNGIK